MTLFDLLRDELSRILPTILPPEARAASVEITGSQATVRVYLHGGGGLERWHALDAAITPLVTARLPGDGWRVVVQAVRRDRPAPIDVFGTLVWIEEGTAIASVDGKPAATPRRAPDAGMEERA